MSVSVSTTAGNQVTVTVDGATQLSFTTEESSISVVNGDTSSISVTNQGPKGDTGIQGPQGPAGADGEGVIAGGTANEFLQKNSATDYDTKWSAYTLPGVDGDDGQVLTTDGAGTVSFAYPKTISENVKNVSGGPLYKGTPVHVTGSVGNLAEVIAADAATNYPAHFVLDQDLDDEGEGQGIALGFINNVDVPDASIYTEGQTVYLGASGGWSTTKPTGTNAIQNLGIIIKVNTSGNKISGIVMGAGRANDVPNIPNGQTWIGNASGVATPTTLATVATSGSYNDLSDQPTIPTDTNLGNSDQTLSAERTVEMSTNAIVFDNGSSEVARIFPQGYIRATGRSIVNGNGAIGGQVILNDADNSNGVTLQGPSTVGSDLTLTLPDSDGSPGQVLKTDGSGVLSFGDSVTEVSGDTTPQLGGDLDVNGNKITSASNGDVTIDPDGTGSISLVSDSIIFSGESIFPGSIKFQESSLYGTNTLKIQGPLSLASDITLILPSSLGSNGQVLQTDASGNLSWGDKFATMPFGNISGRWQWLGTYDGLRVFTGSSVYGPFNYYFHSSIPSATYAALRTYSGSEVEDSTSVSIPSYFMIAYGVRIPTAASGRVRVDYSLRFSSSTAPDASTPFGVSLWTCAGPTSSADTSNRTLTFRKASADLLYSSSVTHHSGSITTNGNITDNYAFIMVEHRNSTGLNNTTYGYGNMSLSIVP